MTREALGEFEHRVLLAILRLGGESYSVPVVLELEERTGREVSQAAVYIALTRMEKRGLVESRFEDASKAGGGRARRYFALREEAVAKLRESRQAFASLWEGLEEVLEESS